MCLQYKGSTANNVRVVKLGIGPTGTETFDQPQQTCGSGPSATTTICGWSAPPSALSAESIAAGGKSLKIPVSVRTTNALRLKEGATYELSFWFKGVLDDVRLVGSNGSQSFVAGDSLSYEQWSHVRLMLLADGYLTFTPDSDERTYLEIVSSSGGYIDNITLIESPDNLYFIQNSWASKMPKDETTGAPLCDATQIGCLGYKNSRGQPVYVTEFSLLCPLSAVGCVGAVDTKNSTRTRQTTVKGVTTPEDSVVYVVDNPRWYCQPQEKGCARLGMVGTDSNRALQFTNTYKIMDPDAYAEILCAPNQEYCEVFSTKDGLGSVALKDPTNFLCEFKTDVFVKGLSQQKSGWYIRNTTIPCPSIGDLSDPTLVKSAKGGPAKCVGGRSVIDFGNTCRSNADCTNHASPNQEGYCVSTSFTTSALTPMTTSNFAGSEKPFAALCPSGESSCFELQDPRRPADCDRLLLFGESAAAHYPGDPVLSKGYACDYYYYLRDSLSTSECNAQDPDQGCVGFLDTSRSPTFSSQRQCLDQSGRPVNPARPCSLDAECGTGRCGYP